MNISYCPPIIDANSLVNLKDEVRAFNPLAGNMWLGIHDEPENTIERYIQDSFDFYLKDNYNYSGIPMGAPVGFEWWFHIFEDNDRAVGFHSDHDEVMRMEDDGMMRYPFCSTITYLTNHISPTIITNTMTGGYVKELLNFPPTEVVFSSPEEGKFVTFDPRYIHGVLPDRNEGRITLMYNVWHYHPKGLHRIGCKRLPLPSRFYKEQVKRPVQWLGKTGTCRADVIDLRFNFKYPVGANEGDCWSVTQ